MEQPIQSPLQSRIPQLTADSLPRRSETAGPLALINPAPTTPPGQLRSVTREHGFSRLESEGQLPDGLRGTLLRNGPGQSEVFGARYSHLFEGGGAVAGVRLTDQGAFGAHRLVQSREQAEEQSAGKPLYGSVAAWPRRLRAREHAGRVRVARSRRPAAPHQPEARQAGDAARLHCHAESLGVLGSTGRGPNLAPAGHRATTASCARAPCIARSSTTTCPSRFTAFGCLRARARAGEALTS